MSSTVRGLLHERKVVDTGFVDESLVTSFEWNKDQSVCNFNGGGSVVFKGIIRGADYKPISYVAPTIEEATFGLELPEWLYYITVDGVKVESGEAVR